MIGEIVRQADRESVAKNLHLGGDRERFPNAPTIPLVDKLTTALRQLLDEGQLKLNRPEGGTGWCDGPYTYLVCGTVADAVRRHLLNAGATDVPVDNTRLFDTWQEHGFLISTSRDGGAVWHLTVNHKLTLTVLKFETDRLFHPSRRPEPFTGSLMLSAGKPQPAAVAQPGESMTVGTSNTRVPVNASLDSAEDLGKPSVVLELPTPTSDETAPCWNFQQADPTLSDVQGVTIQADDHCVQHHGRVDEGSSGEPAETTSPQSLPPPLQNTGSARLTLEDADIAMHFLAWLKAGLRDHRISVNRPDALVHVVKEGVLIVSPLAFKLFVRAFGLAERPPGPEQNQTETKAATKIQKQLERLMTKQKLHRKTQQGTNIHTYLVQGDHRESKIRGWLLPVATVFDTDPHPAPNQALFNLSGFLATTEKNPVTRSSNFLNLSEP
jgi:hypothetical protein